VIDELIEERKKCISTITTLHKRIEQIDRQLRKSFGRALDTSRLTPRARQVLHMVAEGLANKEIAAALNISERTVKFHVSTLLAHYHVTSRRDLAMLI